MSWPLQPCFISSKSYPPQTWPWPPSLVLSWAETQESMRQIERHTGTKTSHHEHLHIHRLPCRSLISMNQNGAVGCSVPEFNSRKLSRWKSIMFSNNDKQPVFRVHRVSPPLSFSIQISLTLWSLSNVGGGLGRTWKVLRHELWSCELKCEKK